MRLELVETDKIKHLWPGQFSEGVIALAAIEDDETIVGICLIENISHLSIWVDKQARGQGIPQLLINELETTMLKQPGTGYYVFPTTPIARKITRDLGYKKIEAEVWKREF